MNKNKTEELADIWSIDPNNVHPADSYIAKKGFIQGYNTSQATHPLTVDNMIQIIDKIAGDYEILLTGEGIRWQDPISSEIFTTEELVKVVIFGK